LAPLILEIVIWSDKNARKFNTKIPSAEMLGLEMEKPVFIQGVQGKYQQMVRQLA
jgi:hypothetical protein